MNVLIRYPSPEVNFRSERTGRLVDRRAHSCQVLSPTVAVMPALDVCYHMTPTKIRERLRESEDSIDPDEYVSALEYVRDDGRGR